MMKSIRTLVRQDREKYVIPRRVQDVIPIQKIWADGIFLTGGRYAKTFRFTDINYQVALGAGQGEDVPGLLCSYQQSGLRSYHQNHHLQP